jgi:hypothetical protein
MRLGPPSLLFVACVAGCRDRHDDTIRPVPPAPSAESGQSTQPAWETTTTSFMTDLSEAKWTDAYALTSSAYRDTVSEPQFAAAMSRSPYFGGGGVKFTSRGRGSSAWARTAMVDGYVVGARGAAWVTIYLATEGDAYFVTRMNLGGQPGLPLPPPIEPPKPDKGRR